MKSCDGRELPSNIYVVQPNDTLSSIAQHIYQDPTLWKQIYEVNKNVIGDDPNQIKPCMELCIPGPDGPC